MNDGGAAACCGMSQLLVRATRALPSCSDDCNTPPRPSFAVLLGCVLANSSRRRAWLLLSSYLVAVQLDEVAGLAREDAAETLLLHDEARVVAHKKPLEVLGSHFVECICRRCEKNRYRETMVCRSERPATMTRPHRRPSALRRSTESV